MSQSVFFAHANGFPSGTYSKLFDALEPDYRVHRLDMHGHDPRFPVNANWENLVEELLHYHAALRRPELYRGVVMLDSPLLTVADQLVIRVAKRFGFIDRLTPAGRTLGRREDFEDFAEALEYFAGKPLFKRFDRDCLEAYVRHGLAPADARGLRLKFDPATEISIYRNVPHTAPGRARQLAVPLTLVRGRHSRVVLPHHARLVSHIPQGESLSLPGGHMFPLERPQDTAALLKTVFARWQQRESHKESP
ncbi:alpha/beta fold hydrolase [Pseudomonas sp. QE6]|uniref:alpha/beta fold hydrolase n=1 Tax=Pseudomonas sp. QE6 TaxID=3242491 RepID=UPI0035278A9D